MLVMFCIALVVGSWVASTQLVNLLDCIFQIQSRKMKTSPFQNNFCLKNCINIDDKNQEILSSILDKYDLPK